MKMKDLIKAAGLCMALALASCGGSDTTSTTPTSTTPTVVANTGTMTVTVNDAYGFPYQGAIVSIGNSGAISSATDTAGKAVFNGLASGAVDVHVFDTVNKSAESVYAVNSNVIIFALTNADTKSGSWIDVNMSVVNGLTVNNVAVTQSFAFKTSGQTYKGSVTANGVSFQITDKKPGTAVTGELLVWQGFPLSTSNNTVSGGASEVVSLGTQTLTTTATSKASA
ncbi:MAG: hypothetical protein Q9N02_02030, partial [Ghiorsea sp.]|nr:hypothetical protein [Ghiorsea sp.]